MLTDSARPWALGAGAPRVHPALWAGAAGLLLGAIAAVADGHGGAWADALSLPGPWIAGAAVVAIGAARARSGTRRTAPLATAAFLLAGMAAYYVGKQALAGAVPGPLVAFWSVLAVLVGTTLGAGVDRLRERACGEAAIAAAVGGWLVAEALLFAAAPMGEAVAGLACVGLGLGTTATDGARRRRAVLAGGALCGAGSAVAVYAVLSSALSATL